MLGPRYSKVDLQSLRRSKADLNQFKTVENLIDYIKNDYNANKGFLRKHVWSLDYDNPVRDLLSCFMCFSQDESVENKNLSEALDALRPYSDYSLIPSQTNSTVLVSTTIKTVSDILKKHAHNETMVKSYETFTKDIDQNNLSLANGLDVLMDLADAYDIRIDDAAAAANNVSDAGNCRNLR